MTVLNSTDIPMRNSVDGFEFLGETTIETGATFENTEIGGLSGLAYDPNNRVYYAISDDRGSENSNARFYTLEISLSDGSLDEGDINFTDVTTLLNAEGEPFEAGTIDPEGIALSEDKTLFIPSEGDASQTIPPFVNEFSLEGEQLSELPVDDKFIPNAAGTVGIRNNLAFESATITPDGRFLYTATENALQQDGPAAGLEEQSLSRIVKYDLSTGKAVGEFVYEVAPVPEAPTPEDGFRTNGLVELLAIDNNGTLLALERSFSVGAGNTVKLFEIQTQGALNVSSQQNLFREDPLTEDGETVAPAPFEIDPAVRKEQILDVEADLGISPDNLEALSLGPPLEDGRPTLTIASDNNFNDSQTTQFTTVALNLEGTPIAQPKLETPVTQDSADANTPLQGDSDDPAIWIHPNNPNESLVISTLKDGGATVFDLQGQVQQTIAPSDVNSELGFGDIRYNNVDVIYDFQLGQKTVDLAVFSDRENDTLNIFQINANTGELTNITADGILETIFGVDDGEQTAYGLATYTSPVSGKSYAFVTQGDGAQVAQLELIDTGNGTVDAKVVRTLDLPVPTGKPEDSQSEGLVVDQEKGVAYLALEERVGIVKFGAEPDASNELQVIQPTSQEALVPDIEGLDLYYGANGTGYLVASSQGDSSYAVFSREENNEFLGSFAVGDNGEIDQANETDGLDIVNANLGSAFPQGLAVVQDGANQPQNVVPDEEELENNSTNFKFVPWNDIANSFETPLNIDPSSFDPRNPQNLINESNQSDLSFGSTDNDTVDGITSNELTFGGTGDDLLDASTGDGNNRLYGGNGVDELLAGTRDRAFGGAGNDSLDASQGNGNNRLYGGSGDDTLFAGSNDRLLGGDGNDRFFTPEGGNNFLTGNAGADQFWIANAQLPASTSNITDFTIGEDVVGIGGIDGIAEFSDLTITQDGADAVVSTGDNDLARLLGINADNLTADQFAIQASAEVA